MAKEYYKRVDSIFAGGYGFKCFTREEFLAWKRRLRNSNYPLSLKSMAGREFTIEREEDTKRRFRIHTVDKERHDWYIYYYGKTHQHFPLFLNELKESENVIMENI